ncbi:response regulator [Gallaecimonas sp. GXIMD4217]|uniref:response regulator n=1 Tax=Gallaecimonas sp. GXIMD4217 TaxID=3131927 RepID=UPI00311AC293
MRVLVTDDVPVMCHFVAHLLSSQGVDEVLQANSGQKAIELLNEHGVDLIISDIQMEPVSGVELLWKVRTDQLNCPHDLPFIIITDNAYREVLDTCIQLDVNEFLAKPITGKALTDKLKSCQSQQGRIQLPDHYQRLALFADRAAPQHPAGRGLKSKSSGMPTVNIAWRSHYTTGLAPLDAQFKKLSLLVKRQSHELSLGSDAQTLEQGKQQLCQALTGISQHGLKLKSLMEDDFSWGVTQDRLRKLNRLAMELRETNCNNTRRQARVLHAIGDWWRDAIRRPLVHLEKDENTA